MSQKTLHLSIDLVEAALEHRQFLQLVDDHPRTLFGKDSFWGLTKILTNGFHFYVKL